MSKAAQVLPISRQSQAQAPIKRGAAPVLFGPDGRQLTPSAPVFSIKRLGASTKGSLANYRPSQVLSREEEARDRATLVARCIDLANNDPNAGGLLETFATHAIAGGLTPMPLVAAQLLGIEPDDAYPIKRQMAANWMEFSLYADAGRRWSLQQLEFLIFMCALKYGEYLVLLPMIDDPMRPFALAIQVINPMRLKTPRDMVSRGNIRDGIELGPYGEPEWFWIKKTNAKSTYGTTADTSENFMRIPARKGHRHYVLHDFFARDPEEVRGTPILAPGVKFFRDLNDLLDSELVSNVITAGFALFIETAAGTDPDWTATHLATLAQQASGQLVDGTTATKRYQEVEPGGIMYGDPSQKPHLLAAQRPGVTFDPFTKLIKKSLALGCNLPYPVAFKDLESLNFAGFRAAMLDAWKVFTNWRGWFGHGFSQKVFTMIQEEAFLRGKLSVPDFYSRRDLLTMAQWNGHPKGDIEPIKQIKADVLAIANKLQTRTETLAARGADFITVIDALAEEENELRERGLDETAKSTAAGAVMDTAEDVGENSETGGN